MFYRFVHLLFLGLLLMYFGCSSSSSSDETGERYYEFTHRDSNEDYSIVARTSDPDVIAKVEEELERPTEERRLHIHGDIERGDGGHNTGWSWHFVPGEWDLVEISAEVCDGTPQMVENDLDYWVDQIGYFCPWSSRVFSEVNP